jgi:surfactin synthase thioesterase subunit
VGAASGRSLLYFHHAGGLATVPKGVRAAATAAGLEQVTAVGFERAALGTTWATIEMLAALSVRAVQEALPGALLYGHSMGGLIAFEVCRQLAAVGSPMPSALVLGATAPPGVLPATKDTCSILGTESSGREASVRTRAGIDRSRAYAPRPVPIGVAVHVVCGRDDEIVTPEAMERWSDLGCETLAVHAIDGAHLFHQAAHEQLTEVLVAIARSG